MLWRSLTVFVGVIIFCDPCRAADPIVIRFAAPSGLPEQVTSVIRSFVTVTNSKIDGLGEIVADDVGSNTLAALQSGKIDIAAVPSSALGPTRSKGMTLFDLPFVLNDLTETARLQESAIGEAMLGSMSNYGMVGLGYWNTAMRRLLGPHLQTAEGLKGKKILTPASDETKRSLQALGTTPVVFPATETYVALQTGVADAIDTTTNFILAGRLYETKQNLVDAGLRPQVLVVVTTEAFWNRLPYQIQFLIAEQTKFTSHQLNRVVGQGETDAFRSLQEHGVRTIAWSPASLADVRRDVVTAAINDRTAGADHLLTIALNSLQQDRGEQLPKTPISDSLGALGGRRTLFFATDREAGSSPDPNFRFGSHRGKLVYGTLDIDLGRPRPAGGAGEGAQITSVQNYSSQEHFRNEIATKLRTTERKQILVYVHGFYNGFKDAAESMALLVDDLKFKGIAILFSWPSDGTAPQYPRDEAESETSRDSLLQLLTDLKRTSGIDHIQILAHSMGGRVVGAALEWISMLPTAQKPPLSNVIFAAPDIYTARFLQMLSRFSASAKEVTLYASKSDQALICSQLLHEGPRAGQVGDDLIVDSQIQTIDVSNAEAKSFFSQLATTTYITNFWYWLVKDSCRSGHSYMTRNFSVINDLHALVIDHKSPDARILLEQRPFKQHYYWQMRRIATP